MNNDLISREALKTAIEDHFDNLDAYFPSAFIKEIDNAPTVPQINIFCENADETAIEDMKAELQNVLDSERPQGEWISQFDYCKQHNMMPSGYGNFWWCNKCDSANEKKSNFCPNCGAKMKGGAE